ncbi:cell division protein SepF [bacterium]|nr:cell division protein SepF [bacterium]
MALSEGLKGFFKMFTDGFQNNDGYDEDPFTELVDGGYETDGQLALDTKENDLDAMYGTRVAPKTARSFGRESKVVSIPNSYKTGEVTVIEPRSFSESVQIVKKLIDKKTVILHLDLLDKEQSQRTIDFICGAAHALNGTAQKISDMVFIFTPSNVSLSVENGAVQSKFAESLWNKPL